MTAIDRAVAAAREAYEAAWRPIAQRQAADFLARYRAGQAPTQGRPAGSVPDAAMVGEFADELFAALENFTGLDGAGMTRIVDAHIAHWTTFLERAWPALTGASIEAQRLHVDRVLERGGIVINRPSSVRRLVDDVLKVAPSRDAFVNEITARLLVGIATPHGEPWVRSDIAVEYRRITSETVRKHRADIGSEERRLLTLVRKAYRDALDSR